VIPIVVAENNDRVAINKAIILHLFGRYRMHAASNSASADAAAAAARPEHAPFFRINASYFTSSETPVNARGGRAVTDSTWRSALTVAKINGMDRHLRLFIGMEVVVTENLCVELGVANGSRAIVVRLQLYEDTMRRALS